MAREMIDSGIEWVGFIPAQWGVYPARYAFSEIRTKNVDGSITNALKFFNGTIIPKANFDADIDEYVAETITNYTIVKPDTIMINGLNLNYDLKSLRVGLVKETGVITSAYLALWPDKSRILPQYATYLFKGYETKMAFHNMGAGIRKTLGFKEFKRQPILIPELDEQQCIVSFLDTECDRIDAVIEQTRASIEEYKKLKWAVITQAVTKGIRDGRKMKDSGVPWIGDIPFSWSRDKVFRIFQTIGSGTTPKSDNPDYYDGNIHWIQSGDINGGLLTGTKVSVTDEAINTFSALKIYDAPFIIMAMYGGSIGNLSISHIDGCVNQACCVMQNGKQDIRYSFYALKVAKDYLVWKAVGGGQPNISQDTIKQLWLPMPSTEEQVEIADYLDDKVAEMDALIAKKEQLLSYVENYKKSLIFEYVTGKKEVV